MAENNENTQRLEEKNERLGGIVSTLAVVCLMLCVGGLKNIYRLMNSEEQARRNEQRIHLVQQQQIEFDRKYGVLPRDASPAYLDYRARMRVDEFGEE